MKLTLESTEEYVALRGVRCRVWKGTTGSGIQIDALIPLIRVDEEEQPTAELDNELQNLPAMTKAADNWFVV